MNGRAALRIAGLLGLFAVLGPIHIITKALYRGSPWPRRFLAAAAWICGARARTVGRPLGPHTLIVANHLSWLDIVVLGGTTGCAFVAKDELGHPFMHWLADQNATVYVRRSHVKGAKDQAAAVAAAVDGGGLVALFPEGTTGPATHLLPFRSTLLEAATIALEVTVRPVALDYGRNATEICWFDDEPGIANAFRVLGRRGTLPVTLHLLDPLDPAADRKQLAAAARDSIAQTLGLTSPGHSPISGTG